MPALVDRDKLEAEIATALAILLRDTEIAIERGRPVDFDRFSSEVNAAIRQPVQQAFSRAFDGMTLGDPGFEQVQIAKDDAEQLVRQKTADITAVYRRHAAGGALPVRVLGAAAAAAVAATVVTAAASAGELSARRRAARAQTAAGALGIGDGLVAVWITERDERVCPICGPLDGLREEAWAQRFPGGPPAHPNCRCHLEYVARA